MPLPTPGGDQDVWGYVLNTFLQVVHDATTGALKPNSVDTASIIAGAVTDSKITGPIAFSKLPTGTSNVTVAVGDHNHNTLYDSRYLLASQAGVPSGIAQLDSGGKLVLSQFPTVAFATTSVVADEAARLALTGLSVGSLVRQTDDGSLWILFALPEDDPASWVDTSGGSGGPGTGIVESVDGISLADIVLPTDAAANVGSKRTLGTGPLQAAAGNDSRLSDARTPVAHVHAASDVTSGTFAIARIPTGTTGTTVALGNHTHTKSQITDFPTLGTASALNVAAAGFDATSAQVVRGDDTRLATALVKTNNLSDLPNAATARTNLGLGSSATRAVGTTTGTVAAGDDPRFSGGGAGGLLAANNLSDLANAGTARTNLGLGGAATLSVGTVTGTVAAGNDARIISALQPSGNLGGLTNPVAARTNLGLGGAAVLNVGTTPSTVMAGDDSRIAGAALKSANLSDLADITAARTNLNLGAAALLGVGTASGTVAAGNDARILSALQPTGNLGGLANTATARTNLGLGSVAVATQGATNDLFIPNRGEVNALIAAAVAAVGTGNGGYGPNWVAAADAPSAVRTAVSAAGGTVISTVGTNAAGTINTALTNYQHVQLTEGTFSISASIVVPHGRLFMGSGNPATTIKAISGLTGRMVYVTTDKVTLTSFLLNGASIGSGVKGIEVDITSNSGFFSQQVNEACTTLHDIQVNGCTGVGVSMTGTYNKDSKLYDIDVHDAGGDGFFINCPDGTMHQCVAGSPGGHGFHFNGASNWRATNSKAWFSPFCGWIIGSSTGTARIGLIGCEAQDNHQAGFRVLSSNAPTLSGCIADSNSNDSAAVGTYAGFELFCTGATNGGFPGGGLVMTGCSSFDKNEGSRGYRQGYGYRFGSGLKSASVVGCGAGDNSNHHNLTAPALFNTTGDKDDTSNMIMITANGGAVIKSSHI